MVRGADPDAVGAVGPLLVGVGVHVVHARVPHVAVAAAAAVNEGAQSPVEALGQEAALGVQYAARSWRKHNVSRNLLAVMKLNYSAFRI